MPPSDDSRRAGAAARTTADPAGHRAEGAGGPGGRGTGRLPRSARRVQLLEAAQEVFVSSGYHAAAMDEIAERAGVSKPVLYQHFPGKLDLYLAILDRHAKGLVDAVRSAIASTTDNKLRVTAAIGAYFEFVAREGEPFRLVFESDLTNEQAVRERVEQVSADTVAAIAAVIREDTDLPEVDAEMLGVALSGMAQVCARFWLANEGVNSKLSREDATRLIGHLAWRGLGGFPKIER
ncbi:MAG TPA: TetR/AcrR family transcriptional regulator [Segeticoccus sp.]|uniref:TetR/AcrR family transcriptional regulator n=1 Tax=Segeticoccus sp. TaxID=2706531 RepID=UPI002D7EDB4A|nr:TetR/AcrR family transcriptional regulator [Segeticoccus sp.]HET8599928.1 TetR/AcrR family transcriptional regulator [Segeticoccus sp.]